MSPATPLHRLPHPTGAYQGTLGGGTYDAFVGKLDPSAAGPASLVYSTYLGGSADEQAWGIAVDSSGNAYVTGNTGSGNFPTTTGAFQTTYAGGFTDIFVTELDPNGSSLTYSTYLGGDWAKTGPRASR
jgi:large repetitive protein